MFSRRTGWDLRKNRLAEAFDRRRRSGVPFLDLTLSNPTRAGIPYPEAEIAEALEAAATHVYDPDPRGARAAREAIASWYEGRGLRADPDRIVLTASTSEAYAWLFKLLCDPDDRVLVPAPSYPLFGYLATLDSVEIASYRLRYERRWEIDRLTLAPLMGAGSPSGAPRSSAIPGPSDAPRTRAVVLVNPNNPTGSYVSHSDLDFLAAHAREHGQVLIADEVLSSYPLELDAAPGAPASDRSPPSLLLRDDVPGFVLDGLSKSAGLPGLKVGWIVVVGPGEFRARALERLEVIADTYLSVGAPVQTALPRLMQLGGGIASAIRRRLASNLETLRSLLLSGSAVEALRVEGGWSAVLRVPRTRSEEDWCLQLLEEDGVLVQPGWFFDFETESHLVVSLLVAEPVLAEGLSRIQRRAT